MPFKVRRRSQWDGSPWASLLRHRGGGSAPSTFPLGLLSFERHLQGFPVPDHPVRANRIPRQTNLRATAFMSFSACSGPLHPGSVTRRARTSRSPAGAYTPVVSGHHPDTSATPCQAVLSHAPLTLGHFPAQMANPAHSLAPAREGLPRRRSCETCRAGQKQVSLFRRADRLGVCGALLHGHRSARSVSYPRSPPGILSHLSRDATLSLPNLLLVVSPRLRGTRLVR
jgi:hypothetical protein